MSRKYTVAIESASTTPVVNASPTSASGMAQYDVGSGTTP